MADTKIGKTGVARRSARTFESDIDIRQAEEFSTDNGMIHNMQRKRGDVTSEHSQEMAEKIRSTRSSSVSSTTAVNDDDITSILGGLDKMAHERDGKSTLHP